MSDKKIMPSLLSANFINLENDINKLKESGINEIHYDVMDGNFVDAISFGEGILKQVDKVEDMKWDVHLMVNNPEKHYEKYLNENTSAVTWHFESSDYSETKKMIKEINNWNQHIETGIAIKPATNIEQIYELLPLVDIVLVMSVEPGKGGQKFIPNSIKKIERLRTYIEKFDLNTKIYVDGGVNKETAKQCFDAGANFLVAGSYIFGSDDWDKTIKGLTNLYE